MSKKFIVEINGHWTIRDVNDALTKTGCCFGGATELKVTELPTLPEVKKIETGVLKFTPLINFVCCNLTDSFGLHVSNFKLRTGDKMDLTKYPDLRPYCDPNSIETTVDFNSIPVGSLIEVDNGRVLHGTYQRHDDFAIYFSVFRVLKSEIKSIRIVEAAK